MQFLQSLAYVIHDVYVHVVDDVQIPWAMNPVAGSKPDLGNIIGREDWILSTLAGMRDGNNYLCSDPRRLGKTSAARRLANEPGDKATALLITYEGISTPTDFLLTTVKEIGATLPKRSKALRTFKRLFDGAELSGSQFGVELKIKATQADRQPQDLLFDVLAAVDAHVPDDEIMILALDEVPIAILNIVNSSPKGPADAAHLLQQLRSAREKFSRLRWLLIGSIGFHHVLKKCENTTSGIVNDLTNLPLGPLSGTDTTFLSDCLSLGMDQKIELSAHTTILEVTGGIPFLIQLLFHTLSSSGEPTPVTPERVDKAFDRIIHDRDESRALEHLLTRIDQIYYTPAGANAAYELLDAAAKNGPILRSKATELIESHNVNAQDLINLLIDDHYLVSTEDSLEWRLDVFRRIWSAKRGI